MQHLMRITLWILAVSVSTAALTGPCPPRLPKTEQEWKEALKKAHDAKEAAQKKSLQALKDWMDYRNKRDVFKDPSWDMNVDRQYRDRNWKAYWELEAALDEHQRLMRDAKGAARGAQGHMGPSLPNQPPRGGGSSGGDVSKTIRDPAWADTIPGRPPGIPTEPRGPVHGPPAQIPSIPGGLPRNPFEKVAAGTAGVTDSFWPFPWK